MTDSDITTKRKPSTTHRAVSISVNTIKMVENAKLDIPEYKHLSLSKIADFAIVAGIEAMIRKQEGLPPLE